MNPYTNLAKESVETYIKKGNTISLLRDLPKEFLEKKAGTFVTIEKQGKLRGCIGTFIPTRENMAQEIIHNAIAAATEDYRFGRIKREELPDLSYTVYVLNRLEQVGNVRELNPKKYGIIIKTAGDPIKSALLLPNLEGINTVEEQISIACQKGGIDPKNERIAVLRFTAEKYEEKN